MKIVIQIESLEMYQKFSKIFLKWLDFIDFDCDAYHSQSKDGIDLLVDIRKPRPIMNQFEADALRKFAAKRSDPDFQREVEEYLKQFRIVGGHDQQSDTKPFGAIPDTVFYPVGTPYTGGQSDVKVTYDDPRETGITPTQRSEDC